MGDPACTVPSSSRGRSEFFFDQLAPVYDATFTNSMIGRAQRDQVWMVLTQTFHANQSILELNCGTGVDALFMAERGISVLACDSSRQMIEHAELRLFSEPSPNPATFLRLSTECLHMLSPEKQFDGVFSNFSGLNCIEDLAAVAQSLAHLVKPYGQLLLCLSTRFCLLEVAYYLAHGRWKKATRRLSGSTEASLGELAFPVFYPTVGQLRKSFAPHFSLHSFSGVGVAIPPSFFEPWVQRHRISFRLLCRLEKLLASLPGLRIMGDHILLRFERVSS